MSPVNHKNEMFRLALQQLHADKIAAKSGK